MPFSTDVHRELQQCLGPKAAVIIPMLEVFVGLPERSPIVSDLERQRRSLDARRRHCHSLLAALRKAQKALDALESSPDVFEPHAIVGKRRKGLDRAAEWAAAHLQEIDWVRASPLFRSQRGRPRFERRHAIAYRVALTLHKNNVPLTKTHLHSPGTFYKVLRCVLTAAEQTPPDDLFPLVRETVDLVRRYSAQSETLDWLLIGVRPPAAERR